MNFTKEQSPHGRTTTAKTQQKKEPGRTSCEPRGFIIIIVIIIAIVIIIITTVSLCKTAVHASVLGVLVQGMRACDSASFGLSVYTHTNVVANCGGFRNGYRISRHASEWHENGKCTRHTGANFLCVGLKLQSLESKRLCKVCARLRV